MIRINLLKKASLKKGKKKSSATPKWILISAGVVIIALFAIGAVLFLLPKTAIQPVPEVAVVQKTEFKPSTHVKPNMIEEVVREVNEERENNQKNGFINLTYDEMSFAEKINYEVLFVNAIFDSLSKMIPAGIGFKTLEIDNFLTMYSLGVGNSSSLVSETFARLKSGMGLMPQPYSSIIENTKSAGSYRFVITCKPSFGVDLVNPYRPIDHLFKKNELRNRIVEFAQKAEKAGLKFKSKPTADKVSKIREFNRHEYTWSCTGTYRDFVKFVGTLNSDRFPCAFRTVHIKATSGKSISVSTNLIFTVRD